MSTAAAMSSSTKGRQARAICDASDARLIYSRETALYYCDSSQTLLTVNMLFTVLHSTEKSTTNKKGLLRYLTVMTVSRAYHNDMCLRSDRNESHMTI